MEAFPRSEVVNDHVLHETANKGGSRLIVIACAG
jgi:hypothetical protein